MKLLNIVNKHTVFILYVVEGCILHHYQTITAYTLVAYQFFPEVQPLLTNYTLFGETQHQSLLQNDYNPHTLNGHVYLGWSDKEPTPHKTHELSSISFFTPHRLPTATSLTNIA